MSDEYKKLSPEEHDEAMKQEQKKLLEMQERTSEEAHGVANESLAVMMAMGWTWDAAIVNVKNKEDKVIGTDARLVIRPLGLAEWQMIQKEKLRHELSGGR